MSEHEAAQLAIEGKAHHAVAKGKHQHGLRAVDGVTGGDLLGARLQEGFSPRASFWLKQASGQRSTEKMVPTETFTSMLLEPSSGSKTSR